MLRIANMLQKIGILSLMIGASLAFAQDGNAVVEAPVFKVGDRLKMKVENISDRRDPTWYVRTVTSIDNTEVVIAEENEVGRKSWWLYDLKLSKIVSRFDYSENAENKRGAKTVDNTTSDSNLQFPLQVSKTYPVKQKWVNASGHTGDTDLKAEVLIFEKIKTLGGEFDAFKIEFKGWWNNRTLGYSGRQSILLWYAPIIQNIVKYERKIFHSNGQLSDHFKEELMEFTTGQ